MGHWLPRARHVTMTEVFAAIEAAFWLAAASAAVRLLPFRVLVRLITIPRLAPAADSNSTVQSVRLGILRALRRLPWRTVCIHQGLATHWMLGKRGISSRVHYGLRQSPGELSGHVWVTVDTITVIGEEATDPHACVAVFPDQGINS